MNQKASLFIAGRKHRSFNIFSKLLIVPQSYTVVTDENWYQLLVWVWTVGVQKLTKGRFYNVQHQSVLIKNAEAILISVLMSVDAKAGENPFKAGNDSVRLNRPNRTLLWDYWEWIFGRRLLFNFTKLISEKHTNSCSGRWLVTQVATISGRYSQGTISKIARTLTSRVRDKALIWD